VSVRRALIGTVAIVLVACSTGSTAGPSSTTAATAASSTHAPEPIATGAVQEILDRFLTNYRIPGGVVSIARGDEPPTIVARGIGDAGSTRPAAAGDLFFVGSITKVFTAVLVLQLVDEGKVALDATIDTYLPGWPDGDRVTVRQLLTHTSGYPSWCEGESSACDSAVSADPTHNFTLDEALSYTKGQPLLFQPGTATHYSNVNSMLLGKIAETVTGQPIGVLYHERVLDPLGLSATFYEPTDALPSRPDEGLSDFHGTDLDTGDFAYEGPASMLGPAGAMASTVPDLLRFGQALWRGGELLDPDTLEQAVAFNADGAGLGMLGFAPHQGFCIFDDCPPKPSFLGPGGAGDVTGTASLVVYVDDLDTVIALAVNRNLVPTGRLAADLIDVVAAAG
jgi:D-alanyl-D-alanine carboxypeptidase